MHLRFKHGQETLDGQVWKHDDVVHDAKRRHELRPVDRRLDRTPRTLQRQDGRIVVDRHDQTIGLGRRTGQIAHVSDVQHVETAVGEREGASGAPVGAYAGHELRLGQHRSEHRAPLCAHGARSDAMACCSSWASTVAVPRFITTRTPA